MMQEILQQKKKELESLPRGSLIRKNGCYYNYINGHEIGISKNKELIRKLARKRFLEKEIAIICHNMELQKNYNEKYKALDFYQIIASMPKSYQELPLEFFRAKKSLLFRAKIHINESISYTNQTMGFLFAQNLSLLLPIFLKLIISVTCMSRG